MKKTILKEKGNWMGWYVMSENGVLSTILENILEGKVSRRKEEAEVVGDVRRGVYKVTKAYETSLEASANVSAVAVETEIWACRLLNIPVCMCMLVGGSACRYYALRFKAVAL